MTDPVSSASDEGPIRPSPRPGRMASGTLIAAGAALAMVAIVVVVFFQSVNGTHDMANMGTSENSGSQPASASPTVHDMSNMSSAELDLMFIDGMIPHHQSAIAMAETALEAGERDEITQLAEEIIVAQQAEIDQLQDWRDEWFPGAPESGGMPGMGDMAGMGMSESDMQALRDADPFDQAFMDEMIPHHESAIAMANEILKTTERPELTQLAEEIIAAQEREIEQMRAWRAEWFGE